MLKTIIIFIILIHGLIHFMGFSKAFGYADIPQLSSPISKTTGLLWFAAGMLFLIALALLGLKKDSWTYFALIGVLLSQILIWGNWQDARFGSIANGIILMISILGIFQIKFKNEYRSEVLMALAQNPGIAGSVVTEEDIARLPDPVQKYIRYTKCIGKPKVNNFRVDFSGKIRSHEKQVWMELQSEQYNFIPTPTRLFFLDATMKNLPVAGFHRFKNGNASMDIRLLSIFKVQKMSGQEMDVSETVTFFNDLCCMAPAALIDPRIKWLETAGNQVKASFANNGITISAWLFFNERGELINFVSEDRYAAAENGSMMKLKWSTPLRDYVDVKGYKLASYAEAIYTYPDGEFTYATFTLKDIGYNLQK